MIDFMCCWAYIERPTGIADTPMINSRGIRFKNRSRQTDVDAYRRVGFVWIVRTGLVWYASAVRSRGQTIRYLVSPYAATLLKIVLVGPAHTKVRVMSHPLNSPH